MIESTFRLGGMSCRTLAIVLATLTPLLGCERRDVAAKSASAISAPLQMKEDYQFQERCGKTAEEFFKHFYGDGATTTKDGFIGSEFSNHYNRALNKCFMVVRTSTFSANSAMSSQWLFDLNEHKDYGRFDKLLGKEYGIVGTVTQCNVLSAYCKSEDEWNQLIKPYMEN